jgi:hypothetical protein
MDKSLHWKTAPAVWKKAKNAGRLMGKSLRSKTAFAVWKTVKNEA